MADFTKTDYRVKSLCCDKEVDDSTYPLGCNDCSSPAFLRADYGVKQIRVKGDELGLYKFSDWLPVKRMLQGSGAPVTYKSQGLADELGLTNLWITFNGWWPEKGAKMKTGTFKECEAYSVLGRMGEDFKDILVVASAGNTARAFAHVCSENKIPLLLVVPEDNIGALWFEKPIDDCVKLVCTEKGSDYFDAISLSNQICSMEGFAAEGGAKNIARRDGMATTMLSAATTIGEIPEYYFQAVGSGTGAIAAWEANLRLIEDGNYQNRKSRLFVSQNIPFLPIYDSWKKRERTLVDLPAEEARNQAETIDAKVLSNRKPPYGLTGGLFDALHDSKGEVLAVTNEEASAAGKRFRELEGNDASPAASVAVASLMQSVKKGLVKKDSLIMLNITGGGMERFKKEHQLHYLKPTMVSSCDPDQGELENKIKNLF